MFYVCSTPIGNLSDVNFRLIEILKFADVIICEDTRRIKILLNKYNINYSNKKFLVANEFNERKQLNKIINVIKENNVDDKIVCLLTDSGTPLISDPGFLIVREVIRENIAFSSIPGPSAVINALVLSGFPTNSFVFYGFIPKSEKKKRDFFQELNYESINNKNNTTVVFYESPYRIEKTLKVMNEVIPDRLICLCREMTKRFEDVRRGKCKEIFRDLFNEKKNENSKLKLKGEFTVVIAPKDYSL